MLNRILAILMLIGLSPVFLIVIILIIIDDGFPVFFIQKRVGKDYTFKEISAILANQSGVKNVKNLPYSVVSLLAKIGDVIPVFPIDSLKLNKITSSLTVSSEKAKKELNWRPKPLSENFKIK